MTSDVISIGGTSTLDTALQLPAIVKAALLPDPFLSVLSIAQFPCPKVTRYGGDLKAYLKTEAAQKDFDHNMLKDLPIPDETTVKALLMLLPKFPATQGVCYAHVTDDAVY